MRQDADTKITGKIAIILILLALSACEAGGLYVLKRLPVGGNRAIIILADNAAEITSGIFYQVKVGEETVVSTCLICNAAKEPGSLSFKILSASGGNLIAVYEETDPERIVILHDFSKGISWPRGSPDKSDWDNNTAGGKLLEELQKQYPNSNLRLSAGGACGIRLSRNR